MARLASVCSFALIVLHRWQSAGGISPAAENPGCASLPVSAALWQLSITTAQKSALHPFVLGLADASGRVSSRSFADYIAQDATFLHAFAASYALALAKLPREDKTGLKQFYGLIGAVLEEMELHESQAKRLQIDLAGPAGRPTPATSAYTEFLLGIARDPNTRVEEVLAAMAPCMRLYSRLGKLLLSSFPRAATDATAGNGNPFSDWVQAYSGDDFAKAADVVDAMLDQYSSRPGAASRAALANNYERAMQLEFNFFDGQQLDHRVMDGLPL